MSHIDELTQEGNKTMEEIKTRCSQGWLIINDRAIIVELTMFGRPLHSEMLLRSNFTGMDTRTVGASLFSKKPLVTSFVFHGQGVKSIHADFVRGVEAKRIIAILGGSQ